MAIKIEKGIVIQRHGKPLGGALGEFIEFCRDAEIGDSAIVRTAITDISKITVTARALVGKDFKSTVTDKGRRVWRIK